MNRVREDAMSSYPRSGLCSVLLILWIILTMVMVKMIAKTPLLLINTLPGGMVCLPQDNTFPQCRPGGMLKSIFKVS